MILVYRLRHGSKDALLQIYEKYSQLLLTIACTLTRNPAASEDILHDVFLKFVEKIDNFKLTGSLKAFLATCVANSARDWLKSSKNNCVPLERIYGLKESLKGPLHNAIEKELFKRINAAIDQLPFEQKEVIMLHIHGDLKFKEIADIQKKSINTVQGRYRYGMEKLRSILNVEVRNEICGEYRTVG